MFRLTAHQIQEICAFAYLSDREVRSDLLLNNIRGENDYTSNLTASIRRKINCYSRTGLSANAKLLSQSLEQSIGCDAAIIVRSGGQAKVAVFEAKMPRTSTLAPSGKWDGTQGKTTKSHFSDQLVRQSRHAGALAVFEMFYCEYPFFAQPACMEHEVSSCVLQADASKYDTTRGGAPSPWSVSELYALLTASGTDIATILREFCECTLGGPLSFGDPDDICREFGITGEVLVIDADQQG